MEDKCINCGWTMASIYPTGTKINKFRFKAGVIGHKCVNPKCRSQYGKV